MLPISEVEFQEIMERNKTVSSSAIARAVQDASAGLFLMTSFSILSIVVRLQVISERRLKL